jgi:hypothetical protein
MVTSDVIVTNVFSLSFLHRNVVVQQSNGCVATIVALSYRVIRCRCKLGCVNR